MKTNLCLSVLKISLASALALTASIASISAMAGTSTADLGVSANIADGCTISALPVAFGTYDTIGVNVSTDRTAEGSVTVLCTSGASASVGLGQGLNAVGNVPVTPVRQMVSGASLLSYQLYSDTERAVVWGATTSAVTALADGASHVMTVYGKIPAGQNKPAGAYADTVVATITF